MKRSILFWFLISCAPAPSDPTDSAPTTQPAPSTSAPKSLPAPLPSLPATSSQAASTQSSTAPLPGAPPKKIREVVTFTEYDARFCADMDGGMTDCPPHSFAEDDCKRHIAKKYKEMKCRFTLDKPRGNTPMKQSCTITCEPK